MMSPVFPHCLFKVKLVWLWSTSKNPLSVMGLPFPKEKVFLLYVSGLYNDLSNDGQENINLVFSAKCKIFSVPGGCCSECNKLFKIQNIKRQRKERHIGITPKCNKQYLPKEEVVLQLKQERSNKINVEKREKYWRDKFENECYSMDDEDNADLSLMLQNVAKEKGTRQDGLPPEAADENNANKNQTWIQMVS